MSGVSSRVFTLTMAQVMGKTWVAAASLEERTYFAWMMMRVTTLGWGAGGGGTAALCFCFIARAFANFLYFHSISLEKFYFKLWGWGAECAPYQKATYTYPP